MESKKYVVVVIPAYEPDEQLLRLIREIKMQTEFSIVIVDDGSGADYRPIFEEVKRYGQLISYKENIGKGHALKVAFKVIEKKYGKKIIVVTADGDGQHKVEDIIGVAKVCMAKNEVLVLGCREFKGKVPFKSQFGNIITSKVFRLFSGVKIRDTQTGLRAFSGKYLRDLVNISGTRYEYEMNVLKYWVREKRLIYEKDIKTIYIDENTHSHFHPIKDSFQIYKGIIKLNDKERKVHN